MKNSCNILSTTIAFTIYVLIFFANPAGSQAIAETAILDQSLAAPERVKTYLKNGEFAKAIELARYAIAKGDSDQSAEILDLLVQSRSQKIFDTLLREYLHIDEDTQILKHLIPALGSSQFIGVEAALTPLLQSKETYIKAYTIESLAKRGKCGDSLEPFVFLLQDSEWAVRHSASEAIAQLGNQKTVELLLPLLVDERDYVRRSVAEVLGEFKDERVIIPLCDLLHDASMKVRSSAAYSLGKLDFDGAVIPLIESLDDKSSDVRGNIAEALGIIGDKRAEEPLCLLLEDTSPGVQEHAAEALAWLDSEHAVQPLLHFLKKTEPYHARGPLVYALRKISREQLTKSIDSFLALINKNDVEMWRAVSTVFQKINDERLTSALISKLRHHDNEIRRAAVEVLGEIGDPSGFEPLLGLLQLTLLGDRDIYLLNSLIDALIRIDPERAVETLLFLLHNSDWSVQSKAAEASAKLGDDRTIPVLIKLLSDRDSSVRRSAAKALGQLGDERAIEPLIVMLDDDDARDAAADALGELGSEDASEALLHLLYGDQKSAMADVAEALGQVANEQAVPQLLELLNSEDEDIRCSAVEALGRIGSPQALGPLVDLLNDEESGMWFDTVEALGRIGHGEAVKPLLGLVTDMNGNFLRSKNTALAPVKALVQIGSPKATAALLHVLTGKRSCPDGYNPEWAETAKIAWRPASSQVIVPLLHLLSRGCDDLAPNAAESLGKLAPTQVIAPLIRDLEKSEKIGTYYNPAKLLGRIGHKRALEPLFIHLKNGRPWSREARAEALGLLGRKEAISPLIELLQDTDADVRRAAVKALAKLSAHEAIGEFKELYGEASENKTFLAVALLCLGEKDGLDALQEIIESPKIWQRKYVAELFGEMPSVSGNAFLHNMLDDKNLHVRTQAILSIGKAKALEELPRLHALAYYPNIRIREAVLKALLEFASPESIELLRHKALDIEERSSIRFMAIEGLQEIGTKEAVSALLEVLDGTDDQFYLKTADALGYTRSKQALPRLLEFFKEQGSVDNTLDERGQTDSNEGKILKTLGAQSYKKLVTAYSISLIDPHREGLKLLSHYSEEVRGGAWLALAQPPLTKNRPFSLKNGVSVVRLLETLDSERMKSNNQSFRHASYRAIDGILVTLEAYGGARELHALETFLQTVQDKEDVLTRLEWTIERLREREH